MFFFIFGFLCGVYIGQEVPGWPKMKPTLQMLYGKLVSAASPPDASPPDASRTDTSRTDASRPSSTSEQASKND